MKLNQDCVRDILLYLEENLSYNDRLPAESIKLENYTMDEIHYTISLLCDANYIEAIPIDSLGYSRTFLIRSLTMSGHELLDNIRDNKVWKKTKETASKFTSVSLKILSSVAANLLTNMINQSL